MDCVYGGDDCDDDDDEQIITIRNASTFYCLY